LDDIEELLLILEHNNINENVVLSPRVFLNMYNDIFKNMFFGICFKIFTGKKED
jgi:hypothetical protein